MDKIQYVPLCILQRAVASVYLFYVCINLFVIVKEGKI